MSRSTDGSADFDPQRIDATWCMEHGELDAFGIYWGLKGSRMAFESPTAEPNGEIPQNFQMAGRDMTCNQMIVLLDVRRGFDKSRHPATVEKDLLFLEREGFIRSLPQVDDFELTQKGYELFSTWKDMADLV